MARLTRDEDAEIVRPILHALILMWNPQSGQWLSKGEEPARRIDYPALRVWEDAPLSAALHGLFDYPEARLALDAMVVLLNMGTALKVDDTLRVVRGFRVDDQRWFCVRMRDDRTPQATPVLRGLWDTNDQLVRTFILQYCARVPTAEAFELAHAVYASLPADSPLRTTAAWAMAAHVERLDDTARQAIPILLDLYGQVDLEARLHFDAALCRAAGREPEKTWSADPAHVAQRLAAWRDWWAGQHP